LWWWCRLFDLIRVKEPRFRAAFYMALRNTLVAPTLDAAVAIAYEGGLAHLGSTGLVGVMRAEACEGRGRQQEELCLVVGWSL
jgi:hypothetical protein